MDTNASRQAVPQQQQLQQPEFQPTVRVMRLYKPEMPLLKSMPPIYDVNEGLMFSINPALTLPDSFGDIFVGEGFSAYISIVGCDIPFYDVSISIKLQTAVSEAVDLVDTNTPGAVAGILSVNQYLDLVVKHKLTESGWHTMKVFVNYSINRGESKLIKKFYRFNVVEPLNITSAVRFVKDKIVVQLELINKCKHCIVLENIKFVPNETLPNCEYIIPDDSVSNSDDCDIEEIINKYPVLHTEGGYSFAVILPNVFKNSSTCNLGFPEISWCLSMGERGLVRGNDIICSNPYSNSISVVCIKHLTSIPVGSSFDVTLRITNHTTAPIMALLKSDCGILSTDDDTSPISATRNPGLCLIGLSVFDSGLLAPEEFYDATVAVFALQSGVQRLSGLVISDRITKRDVYVSDVLTVLVSGDSSEDLVSAVSGPADDDFVTCVSPGARVVLSADDYDTVLETLTLEEHVVTKTRNTAAPQSLMHNTSSFSNMTEEKLC